jgi:hypothetical protein
MSYEYEWPQASPCSNIILYTSNGDRLSLMVTFRDESVGAGKSLSAGGFDEVADALSQPAGTMIDGRAETYREMYEELGEELKTILPYESFLARVQYLWDGMVPNANSPLVEKVVMRTLELSPNEMRAIMALPRTEEQAGKMLVDFNLNADPAKATDTSQIDAALTGFRYPHEVEAARMWFTAQEQKAKDSLARATGPAFLRLT